MGEGMGRHAQAHAVETGAGEIGDRAGRRHRHHEGERAGPERLRQFPRGVVEQALGASGFETVEMGDQGVEARALLGGIDPGDRFRIGRIGAQPVDRLGRERHKTAAPQDGGRPGNSRLIGRQTLRLAH